MSNKPDFFYKDTLVHLEKDPVMKKLIRRHAPPKFNRNESIFLDLIETVINQQLSGIASDTIFRRFKNIFRGKTIDPKGVHAVSDKRLRECGISFQKIRYIKGLCLAALKREIDFEKFQELSDKEVIKQLVSLKGIGMWSAEMMLIFSLGRPDVFSTGDLGLCKAVSNLYNVDRKDKKKIEEISQRWIPYRSAACWYLWRSLENR